MNQTAICRFDRSYAWKFPISAPCVSNGWVAKQLTRRQLYALVWRDPMTKLAAQIGLSDVALRKTCSKHHVPTPPVGHWAKLAHGKRVAVTPLPDPDDDYDIVIHHGSSWNEPDAIASARETALAAFKGRHVDALENPIVEATIAKLDCAKPGRDGLVKSSGSQFIRVAVRPESRPRAAASLRQFVAAGT